MKFITIMLIAVLSLVGGGCASTSVTPSTSAMIAKMARGHSVLVVAPDDGQFGGKVYAGTGDHVARDIESAFEPYSSQVIRVGRSESVDAAVAEGAAQNCRYVVIAKITHWEDRATEWSGKSDRVAIRMRVVEVSTRAELLNVEIRGKSSYFTMGGDHPEQLLAKPISDYVRTLF